MVGTSPRTAKNAYNPLTVDSRRRIVREHTPTGSVGVHLFSEDEAAEDDFWG